MLQKVGKHRSTDANTERSLAWLDQRPEVYKIKLGSHRVRSHSRPCGALEVKGYTDTGLRLTAYTDVGIREIFVHTDQPKLLEQLIRSRHPSRRSKTPTTMEYAFQQAKPVKAGNGQAELPMVGRQVVPDFHPEVPSPKPPVLPVVDAVPPVQTDVRLMGARVSSDVEYALVEVTPEIAFDWLATRNNRNRRIREGHVAYYVSVIKAGEWKPEVGVIMFDVNGDLINGQHRLRAIFETGQTVRVRVAYGLPVDTRADVDTAVAIRNDRDIAQLSGLTGVMAIHFSTAVRAALRGRRRPTTVSRLTIRQRQHLQQNWHSAVEVALDVAKGAHRLLRSSGLAVLARASYTVAPERLHAFGKILRTGTPTEEDYGREKGPLVLLRWLQHGSPSREESYELEIYQKTERALDAFLKGEQITRLYAAEEELFPVPADLELEASA